jgi:CRP-like cAMP-binding protein
MNLVTLDGLPARLRQAAVQRTLSRGETLIQQGDVASTLFVVESGRVRLLRYAGLGDPIVIQVAQAGESIAEVALLLDHYPYGAIAETDSRVVGYPKQLLLEALPNHAELAHDVIALLAQTIESLQFRLELREFRAAHQRVLHYLRRLAHADATNIITLDRRLKDVAVDLGVTPETLSRAFARLEQDGSIERSRQQIILRDASAA